VVEVEDEETMKGDLTQHDRGSKDVDMLNVDGQEEVGRTFCPSVVSPLGPCSPRTRPCWSREGPNFTHILRGTLLQVSLCCIPIIHRHEANRPRPGRLTECPVFRAVDLSAGVPLPGLILLFCRKTGGRGGIDSDHAVALQEGLAAWRLGLRHRFRRGRTGR
jgi:hypothetical protein